MQTLQQVKQEFADDMYSWCDENDLEPWELNRLKESYIENLENFVAEWDRENEAWESWYIRWYELTLKELKDIFDSSWVFWKDIRDKWIVKWIDYLITN